MTERTDSMEQKYDQRWHVEDISGPGWGPDKVIVAENGLTASPLEDLERTCLEHNRALLWDRMVELIKRIPPLCDWLDVLEYIEREEANG